MILTLLFTVKPGASPMESVFVVAMFEQWNKGFDSPSALAVITECTAVAQARLFHHLGLEKHPGLWHSWAACIFKAENKSQLGTYCP